MTRLGGIGIARYKDLCIDSSESETLGRFWAAGLGLRFEPDDSAGALRGSEPGQTVWMNVVPEPKTFKHRVHLDVHAASVDEYLRLGLERHGRPGGERLLRVHA